jgi:hypothetical protein
MLIKLKLSTEKKKLIKLKYIQGHNLDNSSKFENFFLRIYNPMKRNVGKTSKTYNTIGKNKDLIPIIFPPSPSNI